MSRYNFNSGYGQALLNSIAAQVPVMGRVFVVLNSANTDEQNFQMIDEVMKPDPEGQIRFFTSLESAYAATESNNNDVILLDGNSSHSIDDGITWSKNRVHLFGMDGGGRLVQQGAKVSLATASTSAFVIKVTGVRNSFRNVKFIMGATAATALHVLEEGGEGNLYKNCTFTFGVVDNLDLTTATEVLCGSDSATFDKCLFGTETLLTTAARTVFTVDQVTTSQEFKSNILKDCIFMISSSSATALLFKVVAASDVLFTNLFINPIFMASVDSAGGIALTNAASSIGSLVKGTLNFANPSVFNCTNFMTTSDNAQITGPVPTAATTGIGVTPA